MLWKDIFCVNVYHHQKQNRPADFNAEYVPKGQVRNESQAITIVQKEYDEPWFDPKRDQVSSFGLMVYQPLMCIECQILFIQILHMIFNWIVSK